MTTQDDICTVMVVVVVVVVVVKGGVNFRKLTTTKKVNGSGRNVRTKRRDRQTEREGTEGSKIKAGWKD